MAKAQQNNVLFHPHLHRYIIGLVAVSIVIGGFITKQSSQAAAFSAYIQPTAIVASYGEEITVPVRLNLGSAGVNAVQLKLNYHGTQLEFVSADTTSGPFDLQVESTGKNGEVTVVASTQGGAAPVSGDVLAANLKFRAIGTGKALIGFSDSTVALSADANTNVLTTLSGTAVTVTQQ